MYFTVLPWYLANIKLSHWILLLFVLKECLWCLCYGKKALFLLIVFSLSLFLWLYCLPAAKGPLWCLLWCHGLLCCTVEPMVFLSNQSWHTGWKKTNPKIKLFSNYGYLIKSAFVTAAGVVEIGVCKHLYMLICFQCQRCFCLSVFLTPGHSCKQPACLHAELHCLGKTACYPGYLHGTTSPCSLFALWGISVRRKPN